MPHCDREQQHAPIADLQQVFATFCDTWIRVEFRMPGKSAQRAGRAPFGA
jgi:hypothetical protein